MKEKVINDKILIKIEYKKKMISNERKITYKEKSIINDQYKKYQ